MNPENEEEFETYSTLINALQKIQIQNSRWKWYVDDEEEGKSREEVNFKYIDEVITDLSVEDFIAAIKQSGLWGIRGFKQEDLDAILMLNLDPLIMKLFLTFSLGKLGQERVLNYLNADI